MTAKLNYTNQELLDASTRFVVGGKKPTFVNGRGRLAVPTLNIAQIIATMSYYDQMAMGETQAFELVPVEIDDKGGIKRLT
jgi:hypothetical protein